MKNSMLLIAALALPVSAHAATPAEIIVCDQFEGLARVIMTNRQKGVAMRDAMAATRGNKVAQDMILAAYERNRYPVEPYRQMEIDNFADERYLICLKASEKQPD